MIRLRLPSVTIDVTHGDGRLRDHVAHAMRPYRPTPEDASVPDVVVGSLDSSVAPLERQGPARDGLTTASDGRRVFDLEDGRLCSVPDPVADLPARVDVGAGYPSDRVIALLRPVIQLSMLRNGTAAVHASSVEIDGRGVAVGGWSESGKTETALAMMEGGANFLSDKWTAVGSDGAMTTFPIGVGVRRWTLEYLPTLRAALPRAAKVQLAGASAASAVIGRLAVGRPRRPVNRLVLSALRQTVSLADRAGVTASELRTAYGENRDPIRSVPMSLFVHLVNTAGPDVAAAPAAADRIARRLARSAAYERRAYYALLERAGYAMDRDLGRSREAAMAREEELLTGVLANVPVVEVHAPFPVDPHRVAASIERWL